MRIAQIAPLIYDVPPTTSGGTERVVHDLVEALVGLGHEVTLFASDGSTTSARLVGHGPSVDAMGHPCPGYPAAREAAMLDSVARRIDDFDVLHFHTEFFHAPVFRRVLAKTLTTIHWRVDEPDRQHFLGAFPDLPVAAISRTQADMMPSRSRCAGVVHHGLSLDRYTFSDRTGRHVAFLGRMTDQKGPDRAIKAARAAGFPIRLAGDIDIGNPTFFRRMVEPLLGTDTDMIGPVDDSGKQALLGSARALVFPIDWPEPFGLVMIEAMACGTPVVALRRGLVGEIIEDGVSGFVVDTEAELGDALKRAVQLDRASVREAFEARFTATRMAAGYVSIYERLVQATAASIS